MVIWITGASTGLGNEVARQYFQAGHTVCVSARGAEGLTALAAEAAEGPGKALSFPLDITDMEAVSSVFDQIVAEVGMPDLIILNAGTHSPNPASQFDRSVFERIMRINFMGTVNCLQAVIPASIQHGSGHIAVVSSVAGYRGLPYASAYCASKAALIAMCESMQPELLKSNVRIRLVNPGFVRTPLTDQNPFDMPFLMEVEDAAARMIKKLEGKHFEITFPRRFTWQLKFLRILPYSLYLRISSLLTAKGAHNE